MAKHVWDISEDERLALALALLARQDLQGDGEAVLRRLYPSVPQEMIDTAVYHVFTEGASSVLAYLADAELVLREPDRTPDAGVTWTIIHHLYNWL